jgi:hypothetical protein
MKGRVWFMLALLLAPIGLISQAAEISGTYRCWQFNVGGYGGACKSPPIIFAADGSYSMSSEKGTYRVRGDQVILSASQHRGAGVLAGEQLRFEYDFKGLHHTVTYLRAADIPPAPPAPLAPAESAESAESGVTELELTISCEASGSAVDWINTCSLDCGDGHRYDALAVQKSREILSCWHRQVPPNKTCAVAVSSGFDSRVIGSVQTSGSDQQTLSGLCAW